MPTIHTENRNRYTLVKGGISGIGYELANEAMMEGEAKVVSGMKTMMHVFMADMMRDVNSAAAMVNLPAEKRRGSE